MKITAIALGLVFAASLTAEAQLAQAPRTPQAPEAEDPCGSMSENLVIIDRKDGSKRAPTAEECRREVARNKELCRAYAELAVCMDGKLHREPYRGGGSLQRLT